MRNAKAVANALLAHKDAIKVMDQRVGQLLMNACHKKFGHNDIFYVEDEKLAEAIHEYIGEYYK